MKMELYISPGAEYIINALERAGYRADVVGGSVRDALLGKAPDDFDITTSAFPDEIKRVFSDKLTVDTGLKHGTVTVVLDDASYEVTTWRIDGEYKDGRHPTEVEFTDDITLDLKRRDFTVNAMAYSPRHGLTDAFGGRADLKARLIRAVGDARERFSEDALRIMRALRFSSKLGFDIEQSLRDAIHSMKDRLSLVSVERIFVEWTKLTSGVGAYSVLSEYKDVILHVLPELGELLLPHRKTFEAASGFVRILSLFFLNSDAESYDRAMRRMKTDNETRILGRDAISLTPLYLSFDERELRIAYTRFNIATHKTANNVAIALGMADERAITLVETLERDAVPQAVTDLAVRGDDIMALGVKGPAVGRLLSRLLLSCALGEVKNEREALLTLATSLV